MQFDFVQPLFEHVPIIIAQLKIGFVSQNNRRFPPPLLWRRARRVPPTFSWMNLTRQSFIAAFHPNDAHKIMLK
jgi:hypothetical protein